MVGVGTKGAFEAVSPPFVHRHTCQCGLHMFAAQEIKDTVTPDLFHAR